MSQRSFLGQWLFLLAVASLAAAGMPARAATYALSADSDLVGEYAELRAAHDDTLIDLARREGLGYEEIVNANPGVDPWLPGEGTIVRLPLRLGRRGAQVQDRRLQLRQLRGPCRGI